MKDREAMLRLQAPCNEDESPMLVRLLVWAGCMAVNFGVWTLLIWGAARAIDLAKGY